MAYKQFIDTYKDLQDWQIRKVLRNILISGWEVFYRYSGRTSHALKKPRIHFIHFHHVFKDEEEHFCQLLEWLQNTGHTFISYSEAIDRVASGKIDKPYLSFSFDDGLRCGLQAGKILHDFGASACFFLSDCVISNDDLEALKRFCHESLNMPLVEFLTWSDVEKLMSMGHEIGGHTTHHINMAQASSDLLQEEVEANLEVLRRYCGEVKHFSWPYGTFGHFNKQAKHIVFNAGYETCASGVRGCHVAAAHNTQFCIRREHCIAAWPLEHIVFFLTRSALKADERTNDWGLS